MYNYSDKSNITAKVLLMRKAGESKSHEEMESEAGVGEM